MSSNLTPVTYRTDFVKGVISTLNAISADPSVVMTVLSAFGPLGANPLVGLFVKYGTLGLATALTAITAPTFTDADVESNLASRGFKVTPIALSDFYS